MRTRLAVILLYILAVPSVEAEATKGGFFKTSDAIGIHYLAPSRENTNARPQPFSCRRLQKRALASIFPRS